MPSKHAASIGPTSGAPAERWHGTSGWYLGPPQLTASKAAAAALRWAPKGAALLGPSWRRGGATPAPQLSPDVEALTGEGPGARAGRLDAAAPEASANTGGAGRA